MQTRRNFVFIGLFFLALGVYALSYFGVIGRHAEEPSATTVDASATAESAAETVAEGTAEEPATAVAEDTGEPETVEAAEAPETGPPADQADEQGSDGVETALVTPADTPDQAVDMAGSEAVPMEDQSATEEATESGPDIPSEPEFDLVRVEPTGEAVIAGLATPGSTIEVINGDEAIATAEVNERGEWALVLETPLEPGAHDLGVRMTEEGEDEPVESDQRIAVMIPDSPDEEPLVVLSDPDAPSTIVQIPEAVEEEEVEIAVAEDAEGTEGAADTAEIEIADSETPSDSDEAVDPAGETQVAGSETDPGAAEEMEIAAAEDEPAEPAEMAPTADKPDGQGAAETEVAEVGTDGAPQDGDEVADISGESGEPGDAVEEAVETDMAAVASEGDEQDGGASGDGTEIAGEMTETDDGADTEAKVADAGGADAVPAATAESEEVAETGEAGETTVAAADASEVPEVESPEGAGSDGKPEMVEAEEATETPGSGEVDMAADGEAVEEPVVADAGNGDVETPGSGEAEVADAMEEGETEAKPEMAEAESEPAAPAAEETDVAALAPEPAPVEPEPVPEPEPEPRVAITAVEAESQGPVFIAGTADTPQSVRVYMDDTLIGQVTPSPSGTWLLTLDRELGPGTYTVRADQVEAGSGSVLARAEVPFEREVEVAILKPVATGGGAGAGASVEGRLGNPNTVIIKKRDNLWRISRSLYGKGIRWSTIYQANKDQIRDPHWIYPGQVFVLPEGNTAWEDDPTAEVKPEG